MQTLLSEDERWVVRRLPKSVVALMQSRPKVLILAGGFIRSCIANEKINDVDIFSPSKDIAELCARKLADEKQAKMITTDNAFSVLLRSFSVQFIYRWVYDTPAKVVESFDFTIANAAMWFDPNSNAWASICDGRFYKDLAAKRLVYCRPIRNEDAGGSMLRVLKFYQRGYRIPLDSLSEVIARLMMGVDREKIERFTGSEYEAQLSKVLCGLLREVDPNVDPAHDAHLPASNLDSPL